jgi:hypothetical protein
MVNWKEISEDVMRELEWLDDLIFNEEEEVSDSQADGGEEEVEERDSGEIIAERLLGDYLHLEDFYDRERFDLIEAIKKILVSGGLKQYFEIGCMLVYLSERRSVASDLEEFLEMF